MTVKQCEQCQINFSAKWAKQKFCSQSCSAKFSNSRREVSEDQKRKTSSALKGLPRPRSQAVTKKCEGCGHEFVPDKKSRKFCSVACRLNAHHFRVLSCISYRTFHKMLRRAFPDWKCPFCDWTRTYAVHHISGRSDSSLGNLVMLCPNHHSVAHNGDMSAEQMRPFAIGNYFTLQELREKFYFGSNTEVNYLRYGKDQNKVRSKERSHSVVSDNTAGSLPIPDEQ